MHIGQGIVRRDGRSKVTGAALYVDDVRPENCLYGATVRSAVAKGRILGLEKDPSFDWSDITICTADDIPGENVVALMTDDQPVLAVDRIRHVAEPVALIAAPTRDRALAAVSHIKVLVDEETPLFDPTISAHNQDHLIFGDDNIFSHIRLLHGEQAESFDDIDGVLVEALCRPTARRGRA